jgi:hypothetical protein
MFRLHFKTYELNADAENNIMLQTSCVWPFIQRVYADSELCPIKFGSVSPSFLCDVTPYKGAEISEEPAAIIFRVE